MDSFDIKMTDVFWCRSVDAGWITGHSYVCYGPLAVGASTQIVFEGVPACADAGPLLGHDAKRLGRRFSPPHRQRYARALD